ncbi:hypothetical protein WG901_23665 [Novosphingobium sp. PS1R-30]|uniref:Uncharacterized protein n=1 Tax=Novosphingobium anseongense TaxID=3133436 RepID=A0ABU8S453_9SPHN
MTILTLLLASPAIAGEREDRAMDLIEQAVELPQEAAPLTSYMRFYAWAKPGRKIWVLYTLALPPGREWVASDAMPVMTVRDCGIIVFDFDLKLNSPRKPTCGG